MNRAIIRIPFKLLTFSAVTILTLFPSPFQLSRHLSHVTQLQNMVQPNVPELSQWDAELDELHKRSTAEWNVHVAECLSLQTNPRPLAFFVQRAVERFVYDHVPYDWDWNVWGSADYMPTVSEMFEKAKTYPDGKIREDCDGRAVMAATLMKRLGYSSQIVTDLRHVWVETKEGKWMGPGRQTTLRSTPHGNQISFWATITNVPVSLSYGIAVFPFWREFIITAAAFLLLLHRKMGWRSAALGGLLLMQGLLFMRLGYMAPQHVAREVSAWPSWIGVFHISAGLVVLLRYSHAARKRPVTA